MKKFYLTTAIDYVNDVLHLGHIFQKIAADVLARYWRIKLGEKNIFFLTGTDEYGKKAEKAAGENNLSPGEFVRQISNLDQEQQDLIKISYNRFIRTTDADHQKVVCEIWKRVEKAGDIYLGEYQGFYCEGCEAYYTKKDLNGSQCPFHPTTKVKLVREKNYFFKWSKYKDFLIDHIKENPDFIYPTSRVREMLEFAKDIKDIPISRGNFKWGIPVPGDPGQVVYVWFDALINYLTGVGFLENEALFTKFWPADIHILGKDNLRWHALLWPAMLKSAGLALPKTILVNGFLTLNGQKISKSLGNIIRPSDWVKKYGADAVRYYLLRYSVLTEDSDVSEEKLKNAYNADLANGLGNLVSRIAKLLEANNIQNITVTPKDFSDHVHSALVNFQFNEALHAIWIHIKNLDRLLDEWKPWTEEGLKSVIHWEELINGIRQIAFDLQPFLPETAEKIKKQFGSGEIKSQPPLLPRIN